MKHYSLDSNGYLVDSFGGCHKFGDPVLKLSDHLAAIQQLTDRLDQMERERDELKRGKSCYGCDHYSLDGDGERVNCQRPCCRNNWADCFKPRDPSAAQGA